MAKIVSTALRVQAALPVELDFNAMVTVGVDDLAGRADNDGGLLAVDSGFAVQQLTVGIEPGVAVGNGAGNGIDAVAVERALAFLGAGVVVLSEVRVAVRVAVIVVGGLRQAEVLLDQGVQVGAKVVVAVVFHLPDEYAVLAARMGMAVQGEGAAGRQGADTAFGADALLVRGQGFLEPVGQALARLV